ncbi:MAG: class II aldolase/adducin family protein [Deltaproteobacteria bacterium]|nr:class II aldolase/adducin family protein [Deltaproteobacteria bacterium]
MDEITARQDVVDCCRRMHDRGLISGGEGNVSVRLGRNRILVTPSGLNKGFLRTVDLVVVDLEGHLVKGRGSPSSEVKVHLAAYRVREDCGAVIHAHPPTAVAFTIAGLSLAQCVVPESIITLGEVPTAPYATPSTDELAFQVEGLFDCHDVVMMDRHGSVTLGRDVMEAYDRLESLEHTARITYMARTLGAVRPLPDKEIQRLRAMAEAMGRETRFRSCKGCNVCGPLGCGSSPDTDDSLISEVVRQVREKLESGR